MKKFLYILAVFSLYSGCQDVIDVDLPEADRRLSIDALIRVPGDRDTFTASVQLSETVAYDRELVPPAQGAEVRLEIAGINYRFEEHREGHFTRELPTAAFYDDEIRLKVLYNGQNYTASSRLFPATQIDSVTQGSNTLFTGNETELRIHISDPADIENYYLFDLAFGFYFLSEDSFYQGNNFSFSYFYENLNPGDRLGINLLGINKQFYDYMTALLAQTGQAFAGPFETPPAVIKGNIQNLTEPDNYALGYFIISEQFSRTLTID